MTPHTSPIVIQTPWKRRSRYLALPRTGWAVPKFAYIIYVPALMGFHTPQPCHRRQRIFNVERRCLAASRSHCFAAPAHRRTRAPLAAREKKRLLRHWRPGRAAALVRLRARGGVIRVFFRLYTPNTWYNQMRLYLAPREMGRVGGPFAMGALLCRKTYGDARPAVAPLGAERVTKPKSPGGRLRGASVATSHRRPVDEFSLLTPRIQKVPRKSNFRKPTASPGGGWREFRNSVSEFRI